VQDLTLADEHEGEVRKRREVAAGAHGPARGHHRVDAGVQHRHEKVEGRRADA